MRGSVRPAGAISSGRPAASTLLRGGVSERPKEHASKACDGATRPWVQIPPPPLWPTGRRTPRTPHGSGRSSFPTRASTPVANLDHVAVWHVRGLVLPESVERDLYIVDGR